MISFTLAPTALSSRWYYNSTTREDEYRYVQFRETQLAEERRHWQQDFPHNPNSTSNSAFVTEHSSMSNVIMQYRESQTATSGSNQRRNSTSGTENDETDSGLAQLGDLYLSESQWRRSYTRYTVPSPYTPAVRPQHHLPTADGYTSPTPTSDDRFF